MSRTALLAGATGLVGRELLTQLLADDAYTRIKLIGRRAPALQHPKLEVLLSDFSNLPALNLAADTVFCCLGTTLKTAGSRAAFERVDREYVVQLAQAARAQGARQFLVVSAAGSHPRSPSFYSRVKAQMEAAVSAIGYETVHILRPSLLLGARSEHRPGEKLAQIAAPWLSPLLAGPLKKYRPISAHEVARALCALAASAQTGVHVHALPLR